MNFAEALKGMEKVAEHINEMQRIHEEYGAIFDHLFRQHQKSCKQVSPKRNNCPKKIGVQKISDQKVPKKMSF